MSLIIQGLSRDEINSKLHQTVSELAAFFGGARTTVSILILDEPGRLSIRATTSWNLERFAKNAFYRPGEGLTGWIFEKGKPLRIGGYDKSEILATLPTLQWREFFGVKEWERPRSFLGAPILNDSTALAYCV